jgi:hypothetical protein
MAGDVCHPNDRINSIEHFGKLSPKVQGINVPPSYLAQRPSPADSLERNSGERREPPAGNFSKVIFRIAAILGPHLTA